MITIAQALRHAASSLSATSQSPRLDAELLMAHALGVSRSELLLKHLSDPAPKAFPKLLDRRAASEPIAYIIGVQEFYGRDFVVTPDTLIPRPDSELLIDVALQNSADAKHILDLGTGTGALLLTFLAEARARGSEASGVGLDQSAGAVEVAALNAKHLQLEHCARLFRGDWRLPDWSNSLGQFNLILCNPPYVESGAELDKDVVQYEPCSALFAGKDGLDDYRLLIPQLRALLANDGAALLEIGHEQADSVTAIARQSGFSADLFHDLAHRPRALLLR